MSNGQTQQVPPDLAAMLATNADDIERPKPVAAGTYAATILGMEFGVSAEKKTPRVRYFFSNLIPDVDVPNGANSEIDFSRKTLRTDFWLTNDALYRVQDFCIACGVAVEHRQLGDYLPEAQGKQIKIHVVQRINQRKPSDPPFNEIDDYLPISADVSPATS
jgi:hypothetical protein